MPVFHEVYFLRDKCFPCSFLSLHLLSLACAIDCTSSPTFFIFPSPLSVPFLCCVPLSLCSSSFSRALLLPTPSAFSCTQQTLLAFKVNFAHTLVFPLQWVVLAHACCFPVYPFHVHAQDLHVYRFGDASRNTRLLYLHSFLPYLLIHTNNHCHPVSLFLSHTGFSNTYNTP